MSLKRTTIVIAGVVALAAWFAAAMTPGRPLVPSAAIAPAPVDATGAALASEIARLRARLRPDPAPRDPVRNPFAFRSTPPPAIVDRLPARQPEATIEAHSVEDNARTQLTLAGVAEDTASDGIVRTAIITGGGQLFLVKEGETVTDRSVAYKVTRIFADSVELTRLDDGTTHRIALK
jgi:hypothetical protein